MTSQELIDKLADLQNKFGVLPIKQLVIEQDSYFSHTEDFDTVYPSGSSTDPGHRPAYYIIQ